MNSKKLVSGILLIVLGILLFLGNLGYISYTVLFGIFDLWPLIFVVIGVNILFNKKPIIILITWIIFLIILIIYGTFYEFEGSSVSSNIHFVKPAEVTYGELNLDIGAAAINIDSQEGDLLNVKGQGTKLDYSDTFKNNKEIAIFNFANRGHNLTIFSNRNNSYNFKLNRDVIWDLDLDLGAISGQLNLEDIPIKFIDLDVGAGKLDIILGKEYDESYIKIDSGVSKLNIIVPGDAGIEIKSDSALSKINMDSLDLIKQGDYYISPDYEEMNVKLKFHISMGVGKVDFTTKQKKDL